MQQSPQQVAQQSQITQSNVISFLSDAIEKGDVNELQQIIGIAKQKKLHLGLDTVYNPKGYGYLATGIASVASAAAATVFTGGVAAVFWGGAALFGSFWAQEKGREILSNPEEREKIKGLAKLTENDTLLHVAIKKLIENVDSADAENVKRLKIIQILLGLNSNPDISESTKESVSYASRLKNRDGYTPESLMEKLSLILPTHGDVIQRILGSLKEAEQDASWGSTFSAAFENFAK